MATSTIQNLASRPESKSAKKKKAAKSDAGAPSTPAEITSDAAPAVSATETSNGDGSYESPYIKELYKTIRNVNKKISNASKVDNILAENPKLSLDDLVAARKINADQKAQILKKPQLQASLAQLEEQIAQYKKFDQEYKARLQTEKAEFEKVHTEQAAKELESAVAAAKAEAEATYAKELQSDLLLVSQFLRLAAARRSEEADAALDENMALEGILLSVYSGDDTAVATMIKLINGTGENAYAVTGEKLQTTYAQVKAASMAHAPVSLGPEAAEESYISAPVETEEYPIQSDPTIAHAGLTELDAPPTSSMSNGHGDSNVEALPSVPQNSGIDEGAANVAAESQWDANADLSGSQEWVDVKLPGDVAAAEPSVTATPVPETTEVAPAPSAVAVEPPPNKSWADDQPDSPKANVPATNDGFHEVHRARGGRDRDGQFRGRGGRGENGGYRGRGGFRGGDGGYRGRGRGAPRGGAPRPRRPEES